MLGPLQSYQTGESYEVLQTLFRYSDVAFLKSDNVHLINVNYPSHVESFVAIPIIVPYLSVYTFKFNYSRGSS